MTVCMNPCMNSCMTGCTNPCACHSATACTNPRMNLCMTGCLKLCMNQHFAVTISSLRPDLDRPPLHKWSPIIITNNHQCYLPLKFMFTSSLIINYYQSPSFSWSRFISNHYHVAITHSSWKQEKLDERFSQVSADNVSMIIMTVVTVMMTIKMRLMLIRMMTRINNNDDHNNNTDFSNNTITMIIIIQ